MSPKDLTEASIRCSGTYTDRSAGRLSDIGQLAAALSVASSTPATGSLANPGGWYSKARMIRINALLFLGPALALAASPGLLAQSNPQADTDAPSKHVKIVPAPLDPGDLPPGRVKYLPPTTVLPNGSPFDLDSTRDSGRTIKILSEAQMSAADRDLLADANSSLQERAGIEDFDFNAPGWKYRELVCTALPNHLFLRFTRDDGTPEMSMFSVAIPRIGNGRVHIIPIVRKGYSLFSPAPISALTMAAFNRIRTEEGRGAAADWLGTGLCYAALAGANPHAADPKPGESANVETPESLPPTLAIGSDGGATIRFADISADPPMQWDMTFDPKGKLVKASHTRAQPNRTRKVKAATEDVVKATRTLP